MSLGHVAWPGIIQEAAGYVSQLHCSPVYFLLPNNRAYGRCTRRKYIVAIPLINRKKNLTNPTYIRSPRSLSNSRIYFHGIIFDQATRRKRWSRGWNRWNFPWSVKGKEGKEKKKVRSRTLERLSLDRFISLRRS